MPDTSRFSIQSTLKSGASALALAMIAMAVPARAQDTGASETVVVTGFKASLERALDAKREAAGSQDSILAEDIAKFPDINLSESIQRIPGVALARDQGEGREIAVRGLSPLFTRVRINGMEAIATTGAEDVNGGTNRGRGFDFNVFASDLFSGITVHKSSQADIEEGSLGATVDLKTAHPFDHQGFTLAGSVEGGYNNLAGTFNPRAPRPWCPTPSWAAGWASCSRPPIRSTTRPRKAPARCASRTTIPSPPRIIPRRWSPAARPAQASPTSALRPSASASAA